VTGAELLGLCKEVLAAAGEPEVEICARSRHRGVARFAIGELSQHMDLVEPQALVRVAHGARVAEVATSMLDRATLLLSIEDAARAARLVPETEGFDGFSGDEPAGAEPPRYAGSTASADAEERVERLLPLLASIRAAGLVSAGYLETATSSIAVATTRGCARAHDSTIASYKVWALETPGAGGAAGYGGHLHKDVDALRLAEETERAIRVAKMSKNPASIDAGVYDVVMEPAAVSELLEWLSTITFGAPEVEQGTSAVAGRTGELITGEGIDIVEDPLDPSDLGFGAPFDREGTWRRKVPLVERGRAKEILFDRTYASRMKSHSTGSAILPEFGAAGVGTTCCQLAGGDASSVDELVRGMDRGLYVCRLHYVNGLLEPRRGVMTGLTRDGCFLVEKGKIVRAVGNVRFTDSFLEGLARCDGMTRERAAIPTWWSDAGACVAPAIRMRRFLFNGKSQQQPEDLR
jgi:predicted Zn-dependent protease